MNGNPLLKMNILGNFEVFVDGQPVAALNKHASKLSSILCYLVLNRSRAVATSELIETFYGDENQNDPAGALKMQIMRIRNAIRPLLGENAVSPIIGSRGSYQWNSDIICFVDAEEFERLCITAEQDVLPAEEKLSLYSQAIEIYKGDVNLDRDALLWSDTVSAQFYHKYIIAVEKYTTLLSDCKKYSEVETICLKAIEREPSNENLRILLIKALIKQKKFTEAKSQYTKAVDLLYRDLGVTPSPELQQLYAQCSEQEAPLVKDLGSIITSMRNPSGNREAFLCDFEQFKKIYQLEARRVLRSGDCMHVAMLTVSDSDDNRLPAKANKVVMKQLEQTIIQSLRQSDVVAKYSSCQYIIMLPGANLENSHMVMDRIVNAYNTEYPKNVVRLSTQIRELELM